jgi:glycine cleavage system H lipoate-binding protein
MSRTPSMEMDEPPCVWVLAGVLNHRPCHRSYACEGCELHRALAGGGEELAQAPGTGAFGWKEAVSPAARGVGGTDRIVSAYLASLAEGCDLHLDRPYSRGHFWIQTLSPREVLLGYDGHTLRILHPLDEVVLPSPGLGLERGKPLGWLIRGHWAIPLVSPLSGEVQETNQALLGALRSGRSPGSRSPWLIRLEPHEPVEQVPDLLRGNNLLRWYQQKLGLLEEVIRSAMNPGADTGPTLNDGGEPNRNLEEVLGPENYERLVERIFRTP